MSKPLEQGAQIEQQNAQAARNGGGPQKERKYYIDWLRSTDVHVVVLLHCIYSTDRVTGHSLHDHIWKEKMESLFRYLVQIGIPLFFLLSGMAGINYRTETKGFGQYVKNKFQRLMLPFLFGVFVFLIPRLYLSQGWETIGRLKKQTVIEWNFLKYVPLIMADNIVMKLGQLWFLPVLLILSLVIYPLLAWSRRRKNKKPLDAEDGMLVLSQIVSITCLSGLEYLLMKNKFDYWNYVVPSNIIVALCFGALFAFQVYLQNLPENDYSYALFLKLIGPVTSICLNFFKYGSDEKNFYQISMMMCYHTVFFAQGIANEMWLEKLNLHSDYLRQTALYPFFIIGSIMIYGVNLPGNYTDVGFMFFYPIYDSTVMQSLFTTGTWQIIYGLVWLLKKESNRQYNEAVFKFYTTGSLFVYLCHDFWITIIATYLIYPNLTQNNPQAEGLSFPASLTIMVVGVELLANMNYYLFLKIGACCCKGGGRRNRRQSSQQEAKDLNSSIEPVQEEQILEDQASQNIQDQEEGGEVVLHSPIQRSQN